MASQLPGRSDAERGVSNDTRLSLPHAVRRDTRQACDLYEVEVFEGRLRLEQLLPEFAARLMALPPEEMESGVLDALRQVGEALHMDSVGLCRLLPAGDSPPPQVLYEPSSAEPSHRPLLARGLPWTLHQLKQGEFVAFSRLDALPDEASPDVEAYQAAGIGSHLSLPLGDSGELAWTLMASSVSAGRVWSDGLLPGLRLVGLLLVGALTRAKAQHAQALSEQRLRSFMQHAPMLVTIRDRDGRHLYGNPAALDTFGMTLEEFLTTTAGDVFSPGMPRDVVARAETGTPDAPPVVVTDRRTEIDGETRWWQHMEFPFAGEAEEPLIGGVAFEITERKSTEDRLQEALAEVEQLTERVKDDSALLREDFHRAQDHGRIVGQSDAIKVVLAQAARVASTDATVLITGETGTGKELMAEAIHQMSSRRGRRMVTVNCAALPASLVESELFGREKGAFTGALTKQIGRFELAHEGVLFLDEVAEIPPETQVKLLRVLESGEFERLGSPETICVDVRVIAATNRDLEAAVQEGKFREDLYYRLDVFPISVPPLRERREDIPSLVWFFVNEYGERMGKNVDTIPQHTMDALCHYDWPGNVRQLKNAIERAMILTTGNVLQLGKLGNGGAAGTGDECITMDEVQRRHIIKVLVLTKRRIRGKGGAAEILGMNPSTLRSRMRKLGIHREG